jgi:hypothetical protein
MILAETKFIVVVCEEWQIDCGDSAEFWNHHDDGLGT